MNKKIKHYSDEEKKEIISLYKSGHTIKDIANQTGRSRSAIYSIIYYMKGKNKDRQPKRKDLDKMNRAVESKSNGYLLSDFNEEDMIRYLYSKGYRIKDNRLVKEVLVDEVVDVDEILK